MKELKKTNDGTQPKLIYYSENEMPAEKISGAADENESTFRRIRLALIIFLVPFILYVFLPLFTMIPEFWGHILLTATAVTAVHLLDRWVFWKDTEKSLNKLKEGINSHIVKQIRSLVESSNLLTEASLNEIKEGIQTDIAQQTTSLVDSSISLEAMARSGIVRIYSTRAEACEDIRGDLINRGNTCVRLIGISLNDFIRRDQWALHEAWKTLEKYIRGDIAINDTLDIKVLMIDPRCIGAQLRSSGEVRGQNAVPGRLADDVNGVVQSLMDLEAESRIKKDKTGVSFECKLYRLPPILFLCLSDSVCYVQQYHFWSERSNTTSIPVLKYWRHSNIREVYPMHMEMNEHFDWIWEKASVPVYDYCKKAIVGLDKGLSQCGAVNVYTDHGEAFKRINWLLENAREEVQIQGISLHSFFRTGKLFKAISKLVEKGKVKVEVLLLDPECNQAKQRSYRERLFVTPDQTFEQYKETPEQHLESDLFRDTRNSIVNIHTMISDISRIKKGTEWVSPLDVRVYDSSPSCFMLRVDETVLVEQYHYGKFIPEEDRGHVPVILGKDMPVIEYSASISSLYDDIPLGSPFRLLEDHFSFVFKQSKQVVPEIK